jgi:transposase
LFYRSLNGAQVGDLFMSLIHTCQLCGANSFDYLIELQRHTQELAARPTNLGCVGIDDLRIEH